MDRNHKCKSLLKVNEVNLRFILMFLLTFQCALPTTFLLG